MFPSEETMTIKEPKYYQHLEEIFKEINDKCVRIDYEKKKKYTAIMLKVLGFITDRMKTDEAFRKMFDKCDYVGSYFDGLRVKEATEYDINLIMKPPFKYDLIQVDNKNVKAGYVTVNITDAQDPLKYAEVRKVVDKWSNDEGFLLHNRVLEYMESVISKAIGTKTHSVVIRDDLIVDVKLKKKSGPAFTVQIDTKEDLIDVDLVFTMKFPKSIRPPSSIRWEASIAEEWIIVPKPLKDSNQFWRISFPSSERKLIHGLFKMKHVNRLLKALRDSQKMNIASYYIKTVFLWEAHEVKNNNLPPAFWEQNLGFLFVYAVDKLKGYLDNGRIPYYWHKKLNLIDALDLNNTKNMAGRLGNILKKINSLIESKNTLEQKKYIYSLYRLVLEADRDLESNNVEIAAAGSCESNASQFSCCIS